MAASTAAARQQVQQLMVGDQRVSGESEVVADSLSFSARHNEGRARSGARSRNAAAASETALVSASAVRFFAPCQQAFSSCSARNVCVYRALRFWQVKETRAYPLQALGALRAMRRLRACESEAFAARFRVASRGRRGVEHP